MLKRKTNFLCLFVILLLIAFAAPALADAATVSINAPSTVNVGEEFNVDVMISGNSISVDAMDFRVDFNTALLQVMDFAAGDFLAQSIVPALSGADEVTCINYANENGIIGAGLTGSSSAASKKVMTIKFKAKAVGTASLQLKSSSLKPSGQNTVVAATVQSANVNIVANNQIIGDFNSDGKVNFSDLMIFSAAWNKNSSSIGWSTAVTGAPLSPYNRCDIAPFTGTYPNLNISADGKVDFKDLMVFSMAWNYNN
ncbi:MAG: Cohesin domain protein [Pelotomaculum sp. PtaB.Bin104]|nr:MAG: Cohesin domain protein [Pelotomaculum sp. PtaB.Bin104]